MEKTRKKRLPILLTVLLMTVSLLFSLAACTDLPGDLLGDDEDTPTKPSDTTVTTPALKNIDVKTFLARVYNNISESFTLSFDAEIKSSEGETSAKAELVTENGNLAVSSENGGAVLKDGVVYLYDENYIYETYEGGGIELPTGMDEDYLADLIEIVLDKTEFDGKVKADGQNYVFTATFDLAEKLNTLLSIARRDLDEPMSVALADISTELLNKPMTASELTETIVLYLDTSINGLLEQGKPMSTMEFMILYEGVRGALGDKYELPSYREFKSEYGTKSLGEFLNLSGKEIAEKLESTTLREQLSEVAVGDVTLADFVEESEGTVFDKTDIEFILTTDAKCKPLSLKITADISVTALPVFSIDEDEQTACEKKDVSATVTVIGTFSLIGESKVSLPDLPLKPLPEITPEQPSEQL